MDPPRTGLTYYYLVGFKCLSLYSTHNTLSRAVLVLSWVCLGPVLGLFWPVLGLSRAVLGCLGPVLGLSWAVLGLSWATLGQERPKSRLILATDILLQFCPGTLVDSGAPKIKPQKCFSVLFFPYIFGSLFQRFLGAILMYCLGTFGWFFRS